MYVVEITAAIDDAGTTQVFYFATEGYCTSPSDTPANQDFSPGLTDPGSLGVSVYSNGRTGGQSRYEIGDISVTNIHGGFDFMRSYGFDGQSVVIRQGKRGNPYPLAFKTLLTATMDGPPDFTLNSMVFHPRDKSYVFERDALIATYSGTNVLPAGIDGNADIKGTFKPRIFGKVRYAAPVLVNTSKLIYQINDGPIASIDGIFDRGASPFTFDGNDANNAALQAATVASGHYRTCLAEGLLRMGATPAGALTIHASETASDNSTAKVLARLALLGGETALPADFAQLDADNPAPVGIYVTEGSIGAAMDEVAASIGAYYAFDDLGVLRMGRLTAPDGSSDISIKEYEVLKLEIGSSSEGSIPAWSVKIAYGKNYTVQGSDVAGSVSAADRQFLGQEFRQELASNAAVKLKHKLATVLEIQGLLINQTDAANEASRQLALYSVTREFYEVVLSIDSLGETVLKPMCGVTLTYSRYGLNAGKQFRLLGRRLLLKQNRVVLTLWG